MEQESTILVATSEEPCEVIPLEVMIPPKQDFINPMHIPISTEKENAMPISQR